jgi:protein-S-isoprenylcysteine O-methyltransferase Ste14
MRGWPSGLIGALWLAWIAYWLIAARSVKAVRRHESIGSRAASVIPMLLAAVLLFGRRWPGWLGERLLGGGWTRYEVAVALVAAGLAFSVWARKVLAGNWSGTVTVKVDHELIRTGPYRLIRHPIYTGLLIALFGTALASAQVHGFIGFLIALAGLWRKLRVEERWMSEEFGARYQEYRRTSWALIPFVL